MPHLLFWNFRDTKTSICKNSTRGVTKLAGFSPNLFKAFSSGNFDVNNSTWDTLKDLLNSERYEKLNNIIDEYYIEY